MPAAPDANGNIPYGNFLGTVDPGSGMFYNMSGGTTPAARGTYEYVTGPQGQGYYSYPTATTNPQGAPVAQTGINQGGSYYPQATQTAFEHQAGVGTPQYMSELDSNGNLKAPFGVDPTQSAAFKAMSDNATSTALSPWASMQEQALAIQTQQQRDQTNAQGQGATDSAINQLETSGNGADSGARALAAAMGSRANIMSNQNIGAQQTAADMGIRQADAQNKASMLGQVANTETSAQAANANAGINDLTNENIFSSNRYNQQMQAWGANKTADAQANAAGKGGKK